MAISVCVVGRRHLFRAGLSHLLDRERFQIVLHAASLGDIPDDVRGSTLFIVDETVNVDTIGCDLVRLKTSSPDARVVVIASEFDDLHMTLCFAAGVDGYLIETIPQVALNESLGLVALGQHVFPSDLVRVLRERELPVRETPAQSGRDGELSQREAEIVLRLANGLPNKVIANQLTITEATVKVHLKSILKKLGVSNRTQAAVWAISNGLVDAGNAPATRNQMRPSMYAMATH